ncbi:MAG: hypothetical protein J6W06_04110 [Bacteroidales bacterium]|nr:hypothetical protein [Bacteroidales bacterium]
MIRNLFAFTLIAVCLAFAMAGCQKEGCTDSKASNYDPDAKKDNGTCVYVTQEPEPTPVVPTKEIHIEFDFYDKWDNVNQDTIAKYTSQEDVKWIFLDYVANLWETTHTSPSKFSEKRQGLQPYFNNNEKVRGDGTIFVNADGGASITSTLFSSGVHGMLLTDSLAFTNFGYKVQRDTTNYTR